MLMICNYRACITVYDGPCLQKESQEKLYMRGDRQSNHITVYDRTCLHREVMRGNGTCTVIDQHKYV